MAEYGRGKKNNSIRAIREELGGLLLRFSTTLQFCVQFVLDILLDTISLIIHVVARSRFFLVDLVRALWSTDTAGLSQSLLVNRKNSAMMMNATVLETPAATPRGIATWKRPVVSTLADYMARAVPPACCTQKLLIFECWLKVILETMSNLPRC